MSKRDYTKSTWKRSFPSWSLIWAEVDSGHQKVNRLASSSILGFLYYFILPHSKYDSSWGGKSPGYLIYSSVTHGLDLVWSGLQFMHVTNSLLEMFVFSPSWWLKHLPYTAEAQNSFSTKFFSGDKWKEDLAWDKWEPYSSLTSSDYHSASWLVSSVFKKRKTLEKTMQVQADKILFFSVPQAHFANITSSAYTWRNN